MTVDEVPPPQSARARALLLAPELAGAPLSPGHRTPPAFMVPFWKLEVATSGWAHALVCRCEVKGAPLWLDGTGTWLAKSAWVDFSTPSWLAAAPVWARADFRWRNGTWF